MRVSRILKFLIHITKPLQKPVVLCLDRRAKEDTVNVLKSAKGFLIKVGLDCFQFTSKSRTKISRRYQEKDFNSI